MISPNAFFASLARIVSMIERHRTLMP